MKLYANDRAGKAGRTKWFIAEKSVIKANPEYISYWKVVVSSANAGGQKRDNQLEIIDNHSAFGRSRVALGAFKTKAEAQNFYKYVNSYIARYAFLMTDEALTMPRKERSNRSWTNCLVDYHCIPEERHRHLQLDVGVFFCTNRF